MWSLIPRWLWLCPLWIVSCFQKIPWALWKCPCPAPRIYQYPGKSTCCPSHECTCDLMQSTIPRLPLHGQTEQGQDRKTQHLLNSPPLGAPSSIATTPTNDQRCLHFSSPFQSLRTVCPKLTLPCSGLGKGAFSQVTSSLWLTHGLRTHCLTLLSVPLTLGLLAVSLHSSSWTCLSLTNGFTFHL